MHLYISIQPTHKIKNNTKMLTTQREDGVILKQWRGFSLNTQKNTQIP